MIGGHSRPRAMEPPCENPSPMIVLLNGAFGIGKTAVARALTRRLPWSSIFDPEKIGIPLQRAARLMGRTVDDFQDMQLWRRLTVVGLRASAALAPCVIVPMTFSEPRYLDEIRRGAQRFDRHVHHFCLVAPLEVVQERLRARGDQPDTHPWEYRRAAECCDAHRSDWSRQHIDASAATPTQLAAHIADAIRNGSVPRS